MAADADAAPPATPAPWRDRRFSVLLALGFAAGLPLPLVAGQVLRQWFAESGLSLSAIGMTALIGLAYANKFLWSPALDALRPPPPLRRARTAAGLARHHPVAAYRLDLRRRADEPGGRRGTHRRPGDAGRLPVRQPGHRGRRLPHRGAPRRRTRTGLRPHRLCLGLPAGAARQRRGYAVPGRTDRLGGGLRRRRGHAQHWLGGRAASAQAALASAASSACSATRSGSSQLSRETSVARTFAHLDFASSSREVARPTRLRPLHCRDKDRSSDSPAVCRVHGAAVLAGHPALRRASSSWARRWPG